MGSSGTSVELPVNIMLGYWSLCLLGINGCGSPRIRTANLPRRSCSLGGFLRLVLLVGSHM